MSFNIPKTKYKDLLKDISKFVKNEDLELEARFGKSYKINYYKFTKILNYLTNDKVNGGLGFKYNTVSILDIQVEDNNRYSIKGLENIKKYWLLNSLEGIPNDLVRKERLNNIDLGNYDIRFSLSDEKKLKSTKKILTDIGKYRFKNRYEIRTDDKLFRFDLTVIKSADSINDIFKSSEIEKKTEEYEVEIEMLNNKHILKLSKEELLNKLINYIYYIVSILQNNKTIIELSTKDYILSEYKKLTKMSKLTFIAASPVTLHLDNIMKGDKHNILNKYAVTLKADGVRNLLYINNLGNIYLFDNNYNILNIECTSKDWSNSLCECEYIEDTNDIYIYDMLFSKGQDIRKRHLKTSKSSKVKGRLDNVNMFVKSLLNKNINKYNIKIKKYVFSVKPNDIFSKAKELWCSKQEMNFYSDGLIFTPITEHYPMKNISWYSLFKWKPPELNSIDFLIKVVKNNEGQDEINPLMKEKKNASGKIIRKFKKYKTLELYVGGHKDVVSRNGKKYRPYGPVLFNPFGDNSTEHNRAKIFIDSYENMNTSDPLSGETDIIMDDTIVEFSYDSSKKDGFKWIPIRVRYNKTSIYKNGGKNKNYGNNEKTANDIFMAYQVPVLEDVIVSGNIPKELLEKQTKFRKEMSANSVKRSVNEYYTTNTSDKNHIRQKYQSFHNVIVKDNLYKETTQLLKDRKNLKLMEFASGRGGDINRWKKYGYDKVIGIEPVMQSIEEARSRFQKVQRPKPKTYFLRGDLSKLIFPNYDAGLEESNKQNLEKFLPTKYQFDIVSIQFAIHYFFENEISVRTIMQNINDNLNTGGLVIGTCFDGGKIVSKLKGRSKLEGKDKDGNILWSISKDYKIRKLSETKSSLGKHVDVFVKSIGQPIKEPLVNYNYLDKLFEEYGFKKISVESFEDIYKKNKFELDEVEQQFSFLYNTFVYQKIKNTPDRLYSKLDKLIKKENFK